MTLLELSRSSPKAKGMAFRPPSGPTTATNRAVIVVLCSELVRRVATRVYKPVVASLHARGGTKTMQRTAPASLPAPETTLKGRPTCPTRVVDGPTYKRCPPPLAHLVGRPTRCAQRPAQPRLQLLPVHLVPPRLLSDARTDLNYRLIVPS